MATNTTVGDFNGFDNVGNHRRENMKSGRGRELQNCLSKLTLRIEKKAMGAIKVVRDSSRMNVRG